jgi:hypothetical protein
MRASKEVANTVFDFGLSYFIMVAMVEVLAFYKTSKNQAKSEQNP